MLIHIKKLRLHVLDEWLEYSERQENSFNFRIIDLSEKEERNLTKVNEIFSDIFVDNVVDHEFAKKISLKIGWSKFYEKFISPKLPRTPNMKKGKFGEILEGAILEEFFNFEIPIKKWKYGITADQSLPSTDIVAVKIDDSKIIEMCFVESKVRTKKDNRSVVEAYEQLMNEQKKEMPEMVDFIMKRLDEKNHPLSNAFIDYCLVNDNRNDSYRICAIYDNSKWDERSLKNLNESVSNLTSNLTVDVIRIETLDHVIKTSYNKMESNAI